MSIFKSKCDDLYIALHKINPMLQYGFDDGIAHYVVIDMRVAQKREFFVWEDKETAYWSTHLKKSPAKEMGVVECITS